MPDGFALIEARMAAAYAQRPCGWPVGPEKRVGAGWYTPARSVQIVEVKPAGGRERFLVYTFFPFRRVDLRYPAIRCRTLQQARRVAFARMRLVSSGAKLEPGKAGSIDLWRAGGIIGLEATYGR